MFSMKMYSNILWNLIVNEVCEMQMHIYSSWKQFITRGVETKSLGTAVP